MTTDFLRWYWTGQGAGMAASPLLADTKMLWGRPRWLWREAIAAELLYRARRLSNDPTIWVSDLKRASIARGLLTGRGRTFA
jgi:hypothetical protein